MENDSFKLFIVFIKFVLVSLSLLILILVIIVVNVLLFGCLVGFLFGLKFYKLISGFIVIFNVFVDLLRWIDLVIMFLKLVLIGIICFVGNWLN